MEGPNARIVVVELEYHVAKGSQIVGVTTLKICQSQDVEDDILDRPEDSADSRWYHSMAPCHCKAHTYHDHANASDGVRCCCW